jgi:hypothetical protein
MELNTKIYWLSDRQSQCDFDLITRVYWDARSLVYDGRVIWSSKLWNSRQSLRTWRWKLRKLRRWKPYPGDNRWRYWRLRTFRTCCSELQSVWINVSAILTCSYDLLGAEYIQLAIQTPPLVTHTRDNIRILILFFYICRQIPAQHLIRSQIMKKFINSFNFMYPLQLKRRGYVTS